MKEIRLCDDSEVELTTELCKKNKLGIEIQSFHNPYLENKEEVLEKYREILSTMQGGRSLHAPFWDLNIGTKMKLIRQETMNMFNDAYYIAKKLGCTEIVVHNGYIPGTYYENAWVERARVFWQEFFQDKEDTITMCIENQFEQDSQIMKMEIDAVDDPRLKICLDIGHANCNSNSSVENWIRTLQERIAYLHLHSNHGKQNLSGVNNDEHIGLNNGNIDMRKILALLEEQCPSAIWSVETKTEYFEESIEYLKTLEYLK